jgi:hypothetical protein
VCTDAGQWTQADAASWWREHETNRPSGRQFEMEVNKERTVGVIVKSL